MGQPNYLEAAKMDQAQDNKRSAHGVTIVKNLNIEKTHVGIYTENQQIGN